MTSDKCKRVSVVVAFDFFWLMRDNNDVIVNRVCAHLIECINIRSVLLIRSSLSLRIEHYA